MVWKEWRFRYIALGLATIGLLGALWLQSLNIHRMYRNLGWPNTMTRQLGDLRIHRWMTVNEVAQRYHIDNSRVFQAFNIQPQPGDEKLSLQILSSKYHKSMKDIQQGLESLKQPEAKEKGRNHE